MPDGQVLEFTHVTKRFNEVTAVSDLSARVEPGAVTAFLGPNGAGKTTTLRILLGQVRASSGTATIGGTPYAELRQPLRTIGSVLEETAYRPRRTASRQLTIAAKANGIPLARVDEVLALVGLDGEGDSRIGGFSLGMRQRLSVAHALLGDPGALVFDEPANGLDPEGIRWMRLLMRRLADEGRTVLVSSHVLSEVEQVADNVLVLSKGQLVLSSGIETLADPAAGSVVVDALDRAALTTALSTAGFDVEVLRSGLTVRGGDAGTVGAVAAQAGIALSTLVQRGPTLEDVFIELVRGGKLEPRASAAASQLTLAFAAGADDAETAADAAQADQSADAVATDTADETLIAEIAEASAVSAAVSEAAPSDPAAAAAIAAGADPAHDEQVDEHAPSVDDAVAVAAVEEVAESIRASESAWRSPADVDADTAEEDVIAPVAADEPAAGDEAPSDELPSDTSAPSFDEILFGTAAPAAAPVSSDDEEEPVHDVSQIFAGRGDEAEISGEDHDTTETPGEEAAPVEAHDAPDEDAADEDAAGLEIFSDLDGGSGQASEGEQSEGEQSEDDPRSAAVSSMLAAAARAYYEDEPKDYPLGSEGSEGSEGSAWSVASTGVIDTVPAAEPVVTDADAPASDEHHEGEHHEGEHRQD
ncbi:ATP-binding cassette domain-containing protein [Microbacterium sp. SSW1-49]|uniref:ATP-binding cassette domain-containing protein n=1 Tax=Microbacterium croceum TaxID=2851645 RepID=A0ABT0F9E5_9MICO|nr:ATP-binding cassette domain-containing protein [Microbacterium croceum]MCK2034672.1 ATP-binding cassette domain-containing protein [Microbacterium croceum]